MELSPYHKIIPERLELLEKIQALLKNKTTIHFTQKYAKRKLQLISYVINPHIKETIMITAGCHGNEPAPVYALYNFLSKKTKIKNKRIVIVPCIVPYGFCLNVDVNVNGVNINRDFFSKNPQKETIVLKKLVKKYQPTFVLDMHEDPDEEKFFLYFQGKNFRKKAEEIVRLISKEIKIYHKKKIHKDEVIDGIIENGKKGTSFDDYLPILGIASFCTETPGLYPFRKRIKAYENILKFICQ